MSGPGVSCSLIPSLSMLCFRFTLYSPHIPLLQLGWRIISRNDMHLFRSHLVMFFKHPPSDMVLNLRRLCTPCISSQLLRDGVREHCAPSIALALSLPFKVRSPRRFEIPEESYLLAFPLITIPFAKLMHDHPAMEYVISFEIHFSNRS